MGYYIDLDKVSLSDYRNKLESGYLPPSRRLLKERLNERFGYFSSIGIRNVKELLQWLRKKDRFDELSKVECLSGTYLTILLRELNSTLPKPNRIGDFPGISEYTSQRLAALGIRTTEHLFYKVITKADRQKLADITGIMESDILELTKLCDLSRIKWAGVTFARMLYDMGTDTVEKVSKADPAQLHARINTFNKEKGLYKGQIGLNDIRIFVDAAKEVPLEIEY
jgi:hypothetical protein